MLAVFYNNETGSSASASGHASTVHTTLTSTAPQAHADTDTSSTDHELSQQLFEKVDEFNKLKKTL